jgi:hypothetical protein
LIEGGNDRFEEEVLEKNSLRGILQGEIGSCVALKWFLINNLYAAGAFLFLTFMNNPG